MGERGLLEGERGGGSGLLEGLLEALRNIDYNQRLMYAMLRLISRRQGIELAELEEIERELHPHRFPAPERVTVKAG